MEDQEIIKEDGPGPKTSQIKFTWLFNVSKTQYFYKPVPFEVRFACFASRFQLWAAFYACMHIFYDLHLSITFD